MFSKYRDSNKPPELEILVERLKKLRVLKQIFLAYFHGEGKYRLTYCEWSDGSEEQARPVYEDRGYTGAELVILLKREIGYLELDRRIQDERDATQPRKADNRHYFDEMAAPGDQAFINSLVRQTEL